MCVSKYKFMHMFLLIDINLCIYLLRYLYVLSIYYDFLYSFACFFLCALTLRLGCLFITCTLYVYHLYTHGNDRLEVGEY